MAVWPGRGAVDRIAAPLTLLRMTFSPRVGGRWVLNSHSPALDGLIVRYWTFAGRSNVLASGSKSHLRFGGLGKMIAANVQRERLNHERASRQQRSSISA